MPAQKLQQPLIRSESFKPIPLKAIPAQPLVSVLTANYNYARFLPQMVASLQKQTYTHWEAVICDDGSTDDSRAVLEKLAATEKRIQLVFKANGGQCSTVNHAAEHGRGDIICFLDSDDEFKADKIEKVVRAFQQNPQAGVCNHYLEAIDGDGKVIVKQTPGCLDSGWMADEAFGRGCSVNVPVTSGTSYRRELLESIIPIPSSMKNDADGFLMMAAQFKSSFCTIPEVLSSYRVHQANIGGLVDMTIPRLMHEIRLITTRSDAIDTFLAESFRGELPPVNVALNPHLIQTVLKIRSLGGEASVREFGSTTELIRRHRSKAWRIIWRVIFAMPDWVRVQFIPAASRSYRIKEIVTRILSRPMQTTGASSGM